MRENMEPSLPPSPPTQSSWRSSPRLCASGLTTLWQLLVCKRAATLASWTGVSVTCSLEQLESLAMSGRSASPLASVWAVCVPLRSDRMLCTGLRRSLGRSCGSGSRRRIDRLWLDDASPLLRTSGANAACSIAVFMIHSSSASMNCTFGRSPRPTKVAASISANAASSTSTGASSTATLCTSPSLISVNFARFVCALAKRADSVCDR